MDSRKKMVAICGTSTASKNVLSVAEQLGTLLIDNGYRIISGGLTGVMEAVSKGARESKNHHDGDIIGVLPGFNKTDANPYVDIIIPTGFGYARNLIIVTTADIVVAIAGGSGTLSEIAFAWQFQKPIIGLNFLPEHPPLVKLETINSPDFKKTFGWSSLLGGLKLDETRKDTILSAKNPKEVILLIKNILQKPNL